MGRRACLLCGLLLLSLPAVPAPAEAAHQPPAASTRPRAFSSCAELVGYARRHFAVTHGVPETAVGAFDAAPPGPAAPLGAAAPQSTSAAPSAPSPAPTYSTTNNQEAGVDEPDIAKTDGTTLFTVSQGRIFAVSTGPAPRLLGSLDLGSGALDAQLLLRGARLIVISSSGGYPIGVGFGRPGGGGPPTSTASPIPYSPVAATTVREVDVRDPAAMRVTRTMTVDGRFVDARQNGATARLVISSAPRAIAVAGQRGAPAGWVPSRRFRSALTGRSYVRPVAPCRSVRRPVEFSGLGMLTILTLDLDRGLWAAGSAALMADAQVVYGSTTSLYVATQKWLDPRLATARLPASQATVINRFDVSDPARTTLVASGEVPGYLLNQFSLSEYQGYLRVATTSAPIWWGPGPPQSASQSTVTVLAQRGGRLAPVGQVTGLGAGQQIYSVRFVEDAGYVVTFRRVDPLYAIDLRSPAAPRVAGQLELAGYSAYLHPLAPGLLLGVGEDVGAGNEPAGTQLELFDVSDPGAPRLLARTTVAGSSSEVQYDHHAFLFWPPTGLAVLPLEVYPPPTPVTGSGVIAPGAPPPPAQGFVGAIGYHVDRSGITEVGRVAHDPLAGYVPTIRRSVVFGDRLFTVSEAGVLASKLDTLAPQAFVAFPGAAPPVPVPLAAAAPSGASR
ncbi:MAG: hypothetical protein QOF77_70 [Solirubrobacteraceae bacterium]|nr:hypothetical protein [Solirubrobacteraceae bacterium]